MQISTKVFIETGEEAILRYFLIVRSVRLAPMIGELSDHASYVDAYSGLRSALGNLSAILGEEFYLTTILTDGTEIIAVTDDLSADTVSNIMNEVKQWICAGTA